MNMASLPSSLSRNGLGVLDKARCRRPEQGGCRTSDNAGSGGWRPRTVEQDRRQGVPLAPLCSATAEDKERNALYPLVLHKFDESQRGLLLGTPYATLDDRGVVNGGVTHTPEHVDQRPKAQLSVKRKDATVRQRASGVVRRLHTMLVKCPHGRNQRQSFLPHVHTCTCNTASLNAL